tara:strand:+ start:41334 stop:41966 length:633 start_codon:yes stop_codon:yes gene_type:complete
MRIITIVDYGSGNIRSVYNALKLINNDKYKIQVSSDPIDIKKTDKIILPGVGAFGDCIDSLSKISNMTDVLKEEVVAKKKSFLGICVGMQLLADFGYEHGKKLGLGFIPGKVVKIDSESGKLKIPQIGWNNIKIEKDHYILGGISCNEHFYFVHSYHFVPSSCDDIIATVDYGKKLTSIIAKNNIIATQFHPEKSGESGIKLLKNFISHE